MSLHSQREDFLSSIIDFKADKLEEYRTKLAFLFPSGSQQFESDADKSNFLKSFLRNLRIFFEKQMEKTTKEGSSFYSKDTHEILRFIFWAARQSYFDISSAFIMMEDIYDCLSMEEISTFFTFLEEVIHTSETLGVVQQQAMLRIGNSILKKFSKVYDNDFRGRVQLFLAKITSVWEKTAVNLKSNINVANTTIYASTSGEEDTVISKEFKTKDFKELSNLRIAFGAYRKFWELQKFLQNPYLLFSDEPSIIMDDEEILDTGVEQPEVMEIEGINDIGSKTQNKDTKENKLGAFCKFVGDIIDIFKQDPLIETQGLLRQKNYPKYLTKYSMLNIQLKDPNFRKSLLTQVVMCLWSLENPLKIAQKKGFEIKEADMEKIKAVQKKVMDHIKETSGSMGGTSSFDKQLQFFLEREKNWTQWKDSGCPEFKKEVPQNFKLFSKNAKDQLNIASEVLEIQNNVEKNEVYPNYKEKEPQFKTIADTSDRFIKDINFDKENILFTFLNRPRLPQQIRALEPSVSYYFNTFLTEMKDPTLTDEDRLVNDPDTAWRALRVLAKNCLNQFTIAATAKNETTELKLEDILKKIAKNDPNATEKADGDNQEQKSGEEKKKEQEKEGQKTENKEEKGEPKPEKAETAVEKTEMKIEKNETKPDKAETKPEKSDLKLEKHESKSEKDTKKEKDNKDMKVEQKDEKGEKAADKPAEKKELTTLRTENKGDQKTDKEKITERIKARVSENEKAAGEKGGDKTIHLAGKKRSPEHDLKEFEKQPDKNKKVKQ